MSVQSSVPPLVSVHGYPSQIIRAGAGILFQLPMPSRVSVHFFRISVKGSAIIREETVAKTLRSGMVSKFLFEKLDFSFNPLPPSDAVRKQESF